MEIKMNKKDALPRLSAVLKMVKGKELYEDALCSRYGDAIKLVATDGVSTFETVVSVASVLDDFEPFMMPVQSVVKAVSLFKGDDFSMVLDGQTLKVKSGRNYTKFALKDASGFTVPNEVQYDVELSMKDTLFSSICSLIGGIVNMGHAKEVMHCILFDLLGDTYNVVASDGGRVGCLSLDAESTLKPGKFVLPYSTFSRCQQMCDGDVKIRLSGVKYRVESAGSWFSSPVSNQTYPAYSSYFPASFSDEFDVPGEELLDAIELVKLSLVAGNSYCRFRFSENLMTLESVIKSVEVHREIEISHSGNVDVIVNPVGIYGVVKNMGDSVKFSMNGASSPFLISGGNVRYLFAPCRWRSQPDSK